MVKLRKVQLERMTEALPLTKDTQPMHSVTGEMIITWSTPRLPVYCVLDNQDDDITAKRVVVTPDEWLLLKSQEVDCGEDEWIR